MKSPHFRDSAVTLGLDGSTDDLMHDPLTVPVTVFGNFDEFVNGAAIRPGGKDVNIVLKERSVL